MAAHGPCVHICARKPKVEPFVSWFPRQQTTNGQQRLPSTSSHLLNQTIHNTWPHPQPSSTTHNHPAHPNTQERRGNGTSPAPARKRAPPTSTQRNDDGDDAWSPSTFVYGCASSGESAQPRFPILLVEHESRCHVAVSDVATMFYSVRLTLPVTADLPHDAPHPLNTHPIPSTHPRPLCQQAQQPRRLCHQVPRRCQRRGNKRRMTGSFVVYSHHSHLPSQSRPTYHTDRCPQSAQTTMERRLGPR
jgi:hypothetical protein